MPTQRSRRRWPRIAPALVVALAAAGLASPMARAPRPAAASPAAVAPRVTGLVRTYGASAYGRVQQAVATCPARKVVLGAGTWITTTAGDGVLTPTP
ncbi:MAG TPA: hypothetical protein VKB57_08365 [Acidimicrobiales bacterium]|nr:hypothetical protein [Acidimicrobiales bacterium]